MSLFHDVRQTMNAYLKDRRREDVLSVLDSIKGLSSAQIGIVLSQVSGGYNALMMAARYHIEAVAPLLELLNALEDLNLKTEILSQCTTAMRNNVLMLATKYQPQSFTSLLETVKTLPPASQSNILKQCNAFGHNILIIAASIYPGAIRPLLAVIETLDATTQRLIFSQKERTGLSALAISKKLHPEVAPEINEKTIKIMCFSDAVAGAHVERVRHLLGCREIIVPYREILSCFRRLPDKHVALVSILSEYIAMVDEMLKETGIVIAPEFTCPIDSLLISTPIQGCDGHYYEESSVITWIKRKGTSPITREAMPASKLSPLSVFSRRMLDEAYLKIDEALAKRNALPFTPSQSASLDAGKTVLRREASAPSELTHALYLNSIFQPTSVAVEAGPATGPVVLSTPKNETGKSLMRPHH